MQTTKGYTQQRNDTYTRHDRPFSSSKPAKLVGKHNLAPPTSHTKQARQSQHLSKQHAAVHATLLKAGAQQIRIQPLRPDQLGPAAHQYTFDSVEVLAQCLNVVKGQEAVPAGRLLWAGARNKLLIATALLASNAAERQTALETLVQATQAKVQGKPPSNAQQAIAHAEQLVLRMNDWVLAAQRTPAWRNIRPCLWQVLQASPETVPSIQRDGFEGELQACTKLRAALQDGWQLETGAILDMTQHPGYTGDRGVSIKGIKGELDAVLVDPQGISQGVLEIKLGGTVPFRTVYNDVRKLKRVMDWVRGNSIRVLEPGADMRNDSTNSAGSVSTSNGKVLHFSPTALPCYLVLEANKLMDGREVLLEAEQALLQINLSMALGSARAWQGVQLEKISPQRTVLKVPEPLVASMRRKVAKDFVTTVASASIYQM